MKRVLVANRGEIAVRLLRGARRCGYETVAVYSDADAAALHVREADRAVRLGAAPAAESYLSIERVLAAARSAGADAIHPGYGFLSERAAFARAVAEAGLTFIGPSAAAIDAMGDKSAAKARMLAAGVPCIPGFHGRSAAEQSDESLEKQARAIGFPLMIKAAAGGGGRGMRLVHDDSSLVGSLRAARSEAASAFGDGTLLLERALASARHVEIQVLGDQHGSILHLGERDCSIQRRNQKVVEESPSPAVAAALRSRMGEAAVRAARSVEYVGAGTVEFMLDADGQFYFLEMNTRLQVEHPVTELTLDLDLVEWQLRIAEGEALPWTQAELDARRRGHAIEVRLCAEDAAFRPRTGTVLRWDAPRGPGIRVDTCLETSAVVSPHYDSMLGKIIAYGADREEARRRLVRALESTCVLGVDTNRDLLHAIVAGEVFAGGSFATDYFARHAVAEPSTPSWHAALAAVVLEIDDAWRLQEGHGFSASLAGWDSCVLAATPVLLEQGEARHLLRVARSGGGFSVTIGEGAAPAQIDFAAARRVDAENVCYTRDAQDARARYARDGERLWLDAGGITALYVDRTYAPALRADEASGTVRARSDGKIVRLGVAVGDTVEKGQLLCVLESMKMEFELVAPHAGTVLALHVDVGDQVQAKRPLCEVG